MALEKRLSHIKRKESENRIKFGQQINISVLADNPTGCSHCSYDSQYKVSRDPNCSYCGGKYWIYATTVHNEYVKVRWIAEAVEEEIVIGNLQVGDCVLIARIESRSFFENTIKYETRIDIDPLGGDITPISDSIEVIPQKIVIDTLKSEIAVSCSRVYKD